MATFMWLYLRVRWRPAVIIIPNRARRNKCARADKTSVSHLVKRSYLRFQDTGHPPLKPYCQPIMPLIGAALDGKSPEWRYTMLTEPSIPKFLSGSDKER